jgi:hypothetical protein
MQTRILKVYYKKINPNIERYRTIEKNLIYFMFKRIY